MSEKPENEIKNLLSKMDDWVFFHDLLEESSFEGSTGHNKLAEILRKMQSNGEIEVQENIDKNTRYVKYRLV